MSDTIETLLAEFVDDAHQSSVRRDAEEFQRHVEDDASVVCEAAAFRVAAPEVPTRDIADVSGVDREEIVEFVRSCDTSFDRDPRELLAQAEIRERAEEGTVPERVATSAAERVERVVYSDRSALLGIGTVAAVTTYWAGLVESHALSPSQAASTFDADTDKVVNAISLLQSRLFDDVDTDGGHSLPALDVTRRRKTGQGSVRPSEEAASALDDISDAVGVPDVIGSTFSDSLVDAVGEQLTSFGWEERGRREPFFVDPTGTVVATFVTDPDSGKARQTVEALREFVLTNSPDTAVVVTLPSLAVEGNRSAETADEYVREANEMAGLVSRLVAEFGSGQYHGFPLTVVETAVVRGETDESAGRDSWPPTQPQSIDYE